LLAGILVVVTQSALPDRRFRPVPSTAPPGPIDEAVLAVLRWCENRVGESTEALAAAYGIGRFAGMPPLPASRVGELAGRSGTAIRGRLGGAAQLARRVGPPPELLAALDLVEALGAIRVGLLSRALVRLGLACRPLHPMALAQIATLFGLRAGFQLLGPPQFPAGLVVADPLTATLGVAVARLRQRLLIERMVPVSAIASGMSGHALLEALAAADLLSADGQHAIDPNPHGVDWGIGRMLAAAARPLQVEQLVAGLRRWARDRGGQLGAASNSAWLMRYLTSSPLYEGRESGWSTVGSWPRQSAVDKELIDVIHRVGGSATTKELTRALITRGQVCRPRTAGHAVAVSPVLTHVVRGWYALIGSEPSQLVPREKPPVDDSRAATLGPLSHAGSDSVVNG